MSNRITQQIVGEILAGLDLPESANDKADRRYKDLADWFGSDAARCSDYAPHIYPQGSFRLGTVVRPRTDEESYDLDVGCRLLSGVTKSTHTQKQLKELVGVDLEAYRKARGIENALEERRRCWRLKYADELSFHMDAVPSIPESAARRQLIREAMVAAGTEDFLAESVANHTGAITDTGDANFAVISANWHLSNSEGFALWFRSRMKLARLLLENRALEERVAKIDDLPSYKWKSPLQRSIQVLKRHRDVMFSDNPDSKPISVIITTLAARAYRGETELDDALRRILGDMHQYVLKSAPMVPNPVNPAEDFADKWYDPKYSRLRLRENFDAWLEQAKSDFGIIDKSRDVKQIVEQAGSKFGVTLNEDDLGEKLNLGAAYVVTAPKVHNIAAVPAKPWWKD